MFFSELNFVTWLKSFYMFYPKLSLKATDSSCMQTNTRENQLPRMYSRKTRNDDITRCKKHWQLCVTPNTERKIKEGELNLYIYIVPQMASVNDPASEASLTDPIIPPEKIDVLIARNACL